MANKQMHHLVIDGDNYEIVDLVARQGGGSGGSITVDSALSGTSENPVQNKVIKTALDGKASTAVATTSSAGLMSATDKANLDTLYADYLSASTVLG